MMRWLAFLLIPLCGIVFADEESLQLRDLDGKVHAPFASGETKAVMIVFVSTDCPIANYFQPTLRRLQEEFGDQGVVFFQVHPDPEVPVAEAKKHREEFEVRCPVVIDKGQAVTKRLAATTTPEAFVLTEAGKVAYRGRIDDTYTDFGKRRPEPRTRDLHEALTAVVAGKNPPVPVTEPVGCRIFVEK